MNLKDKMLMIFKIDESLFTDLLCENNLALDGSIMAANIDLSMDELFNTSNIRLNRNSVVELTRIPGGVKLINSLKNWTHTLSRL